MQDFKKSSPGRHDPNQCGRKSADRHQASSHPRKKALEIAFAEDTAVLVEEFIPGTEYRFFILDGRCEAVLLRVAANVVGDGKHTIRELVAQKNANPLRGRDHRSPLEIIALGDIEQLMLTQQDRKSVV